MKAFYDTNILVAAVTDDTDRSDSARRLLDAVDDGYTSLLNVMELRTVLAKRRDSNGTESSGSRIGYRDPRP